MTLEEFSRTWERIIQTYGKYPPERANIIYQSYKVLPYQDFNQAISNIIASERYMPMPEVFHKHLRSKMQDYRTHRVAQLSKKTPCHKCNSSGVLVIRSEVKHMSGIAYQCSCNFGRLNYPSLSQYNGYKNTESINLKVPDCMKPRSEQRKNKLPDGLNGLNLNVLD